MLNFEEYYGIIEGQFLKRKGSRFGQLMRHAYRIQMPVLEAIEAIAIWLEEPHIIAIPRAELIEAVDMTRLHAEMVLA